MENIDKLPKSEKLKKYLQNLERYQNEIRELFICKEISEDDHKKMIDDSQAKYKEFLKTL